VKIGVKRTSVRAWIVGIAVLFFAGFPTDVSAESNLAAPDFQTKASFDLVIRSAFVTYTNEFFGGRTNALKIQFFTQRIGAETQAKLLKRDDRDIGKNGYAGLVLFLDAQDRVRQANLTYVIPGTTVVRTVASSPEELTRYISDYHFDRSRLRLKSRGTYKTAFDEKDEVLTLSWDTDIDLRVFDQIKR
jgi:hypothetical protein